MLVKILLLLFLAYLHYCSVTSNRKNRRIVVYERDHLQSEKKYTRLFDASVVRSSSIRKDFGTIREGIEYALMDEDALESTLFLKQPRFVEMHMDISKDRADSLFLLLERLLLGEWNDGEVFLERGSLMGFGGICYGHKACRFTIFLNIQRCTAVTNFMHKLFMIVLTKSIKGITSFIAESEGPFAICQQDHLQDWKFVVQSKKQAQVRHDFGSVNVSVNGVRGFEFLKDSPGTDWRYLYLREGFGKKIRGQLERMAGLEIKLPCQLAHLVVQFAVQVFVIVAVRMVLAALY